MATTIKQQYNYVTVDATCNPKHPPPQMEKEEYQTFEDLFYSKTFWWYRLLEKLLMYIFSTRNL